MYVPNYIPEPLEVPGNVTLRPYIERVQFVRSVTWLHFVSLLTAAVIGFIPHGAFPLAYNALVLTSLLTLLDLLRIQLRGRVSEAHLSSAFLPLVLVFTGWLGNDMFVGGWPTWSILFGAVSMVLYTSICGRDYSFVGCYFLSLIVSSVLIAAVTTLMHLPSALTGRALLLDVIYLSYAVYDLASLMARRRQTEILAAVTDLYRDVFNFFGYFYRCIQHWKKHQIWVTPK